jgi:hypothetical protein
MSRRPWLFALPLMLAATGCSLDEPVFVCRDDGDCSGGHRCGADGECVLDAGPGLVDGDAGRRDNDVNPPIDSGPGDAGGGLDAGDGGTQDAGATDGGALDGGVVDGGAGDGGADAGAGCPVLWWDCLWHERVSYTLQQSAPSQPIAALPTLLRISPSDAALTSAAVDGSDLRVVADDHVTEMPFELERFDPAGETLVWVRMNVTTGTERVWLYWGHEASVTPPDDATTRSTWLAYSGVWHMGAPPTDASPSAIASTSAGDVDASGVINRARYFAGTGTYIGAGTDASHASLGDLTVSAWVRMNVRHQGAWDNTILARTGVGDAAAANYHYSLWLDGTSGRLALSWESGGGTNHHHYSTQSADVVLDQWVHLAVVRDATGALGGSQRIYFLVNGMPLGDAVPYPTAPTDGSAGELYIGADPDDAATWRITGDVDELRISTSASSLERMELEYAAMKDADFGALGTPQAH